MWRTLLGLLCICSHSLAYTPFSGLPQHGSRLGGGIMRTQTRREVPRMPSTEPQVPYKAPGQEVASWVSINQRMQRSRIIIIGKFIDQEYANALIATLLYLEKDDPKKGISLYFNSPGAQLRPALAIYDTLRHCKFPITTLNLGLATGMISFLCAAGDRGKRFALPNARFLMQRTGMEDPFQGQASDIGIEVAQTKRQNDKMEEEMQLITGHTKEKIREDFARDFYLSAAEACQYGICDEVLQPRPKTRRKAFADMQFGKPWPARSTECNRALTYVLTLSKFLSSQAWPAATKKMTTQGLGTLLRRIRSSRAKRGAALAVRPRLDQTQEMMMDQPPCSGRRCCGMNASAQMEPALLLFLNPNHSNVLPSSLEL
ncbi:unnamed protein product [Chrysoparadoxa australica]